MPSKEMAWPPPGECYHIKTHGGMGDCLWVYKKLQNLPLPLFLTISEENRTRPRRSGILADHLPRVVGWRFDDQTFATGGQDWPHPDDPCCAIGKTWAELDWEPNTAKPYRIECNRWLEGGRRIEDWLPDLATTHHFEFEPPGPGRIEFRKPYVVFHLAGWPDVPDQVWRTACRLFGRMAHVYVVGGSYDHRPRTVARGLDRDGVTLLEDLGWADLFNLIRGAEYVFGHASGFTALADVLRSRGAVVNPRSVPKLTGTWNSPDNPGLLYVERTAEFEAAVHGAYRNMAEESNHTWPPTGTRGGRIAAVADDPVSAVREAAAAALPRHVLIAATGDHPDWLGAAVLDGVYSAGRVVEGVYLVGCSVDAVAGTYRESARSSRRPVVKPMAAEDARTDRFSGIDLAVVYTGADATLAYRAACDAWRRMTARGTLLVGGPTARAVVGAVASSLRIKPGQVTDSSGWFFVYRRL